MYINIKKHGKASVPLSMCSNALDTFVQPLLAARVIEYGKIGVEVTFEAKGNTPKHTKKVKLVGRA